MSKTKNVVSDSMISAGLEITGKKVTDFVTELNVRGYDIIPAKEYAEYVTLPVKLHDSIKVQQKFTQDRITTNDELGYNDSVSAWRGYNQALHWLSHKIDQLIKEK